MAYGYNQSQSPPMQGPGWGGLQPTPPLSPYPNGQPQYPAVGAPTPVIDAAALTPGLQPAYQAPQFAPPPAIPKPASGGGVLKSLNFFSMKPSYQQQINNGESSLSVHGSPPVGNPVFAGPQQYGAVGGQAVGSGVQPSPMTPVVYNQGYTAPPVSPYSPLAPAGQPGPTPMYQPSPVAGPVFQQPQQYQEQPQHQQPHQQVHHQQQAPQPQPQPAHQPQHPQQQQQYPQQQQQHPQQQQQYPQQQQYLQQQQHPQQQHPQQQHPQQQQQQSYIDPAAPPPAYSQGPDGKQQWPEKPTIQSNYAAAPAAPAAQATQAAQAALPNTGQASVPQPGPQTKPQAPDDTKYWASLVSQGTIPLAPKAQLRSLFRGIAVCIVSAPSRTPRVC